MKDTIKNLTEKETKLFQSVVKGMDARGAGYLHEIADESLSTNGVLGSLIKKGLVTSEDQWDEGMLDVSGPLYWVEITDEARASVGLEND